MATHNLQLLPLLLWLALVYSGSAAPAKPTTNVRPAMATSAYPSVMTVSPRHDHEMDTPYGAHLQPILTVIKATPDQKVKIAAIVESYKPKIEPLRQEYRIKSAEFLDMLMKGSPAEVIMARQGELNKVYSLIIVHYASMQLEIRKQLTPEQTVLFEQYRRQEGWASAR